MGYPYPQSLVVLVVGGVPWLVYSTGRLSTGGRKEMDLGVFGIENVWCFGDVVVNGKLGRLVHNLRKIPNQG